LTIGVSEQTSETVPPSTLSVTVSVLTYRRPELLVTALRSIEDRIDSDRRSDRSWHLKELLVVDNDDRPSAHPAVEQLADNNFALPLRYVHEPAPGLSAARNRALDEATTDILVFMDDDETAGPQWPDGLIEMMMRTDANLVGGPVRTVFSHQPPTWAATGLFDRAEPMDGARQHWLRSGNLAIDLTSVNELGLRFDPRFGTTGGEDVAFSREAERLGLTLRWCHGAPVTEQVGPERTTIRWVSKRERVSTANWVRAELLQQQYQGLGHGLRHRLLIASRGSFRLLQGMATVLAGLGTLHSGRAVKGLVVASRGIGAFQGLANHTTSTYGNAADKT